jgi:hypothetical protein
MELNWVIPGKEMESHTFSPNLPNLFKLLVNGQVCFDHPHRIFCTEFASEIRISD